MWCVLFVLLSYVDRNLVKGDFVDVEVQSRDTVSTVSTVSGAWCVKVSAVVGENSLHRVSDGAEVVSSVLSPSGHLENCTVTVNHMEVKAFMQECRLEVKEQQKMMEKEEEEASFTRMSAAKRKCHEFHERSVKKQEPGDEVLKRSKRGFTYPGTMWCGAGNMADHYDQLGHFAETDSCCRTHDHCPHVIHAFSSKYGYTNFKWHSICHCDCDTELKSCLRKVNDTSSRVVGQAFFNVIGVPCFELIYEERCAERHWYGLCKSYEKLPIAVIKEAEPYDYGGIDVIDELTLAPPTKKSEEEEKPESTTQSTVSGHEEPSLTNVVTAAEDFIKVLATVSTSQSSTSDSNKGETQSSEKKKKKKKSKGKKKKKSKKQKGKGRKRKQKAEAGVTTEEGAAVSPPGSKAGEVMALSNFISESHKHDQSSTNTNTVADSEYELRGKDEPDNEVMKDEPATDKDPVSVTSPTVVHKKPAVMDTDALTGETEPSTSTNTTIIPLQGQIKGMRRKERRKKHKKVPALSSEGLLMNTTDITSSTSTPTVVTITTTTQPEQQSLEIGPVVTYHNGIPKAKRNRSKERGDRKRRKKRRKDGSVVDTGTEHSSVKVIPLHGTPAASPVSTTELQVSHRLDVHATALNSSFSVLKRSKHRGLRPRKTNVPPAGESNDNISENMSFIETTPDSVGGPNVNATTAALSRPMERLQDSEWKLFTTAAPTVYVKRQRHPLRQQRKSENKVLAAAAPISGRLHVPAQTERTPVTFTTSRSKVTAAEELSPQRFETARWTTPASPDMSPIQLSFERVKAQFSRKKRRKVALSFRRQ